MELDLNEVTDATGSGSYPKSGFHISGVRLQVLRTTRNVVNYSENNVNP